MLPFRKGKRMKRLSLCIATPVSFPPAIPIKIDDSMILEIKDHTSDDDPTVILPKAEILRQLSKMQQKNFRPWKWHVFEPTKNWIDRYLARNSK